MRAHVLHICQPIEEIADNDDPMQLADLRRREARAIVRVEPEHELPHDTLDLLAVHIRNMNRLLAKGRVPDRAHDWDHHPARVEHAPA
jgi:hypothetical protein